MAKQLTPAQRAQFATDGFLLVPGLVSPAAVRAARATIAESLESDDSIGQMRRYLSDTFCAPILQHRDVLALLDPIRPLASSLFGPTAVPPRAGIPQIALRFPQRDPSAHHHGFHLDGFPAAGNGVPAGTVFRQTLVAGVYLTPLRGPDRGNLLVWPGSHRFFARYLRALDAPRALREHGAEALLAKIRAQDPGVAPRSIDAEPGDVLLMHHLLAHAAGDNLSLRTREAVYFRLLHPDDHVSDPTPLTDERRFFAAVDWSA